MSFILETKLNKPQLSERLISRSDLINKLTAGLSRTLTLVSAPAGYGKTTLINQWINQLNRPVAWYSIDKSDSDRVYFLTYLISAIRKIQPDIGNDALKMLQSQSKPPSMEYILGSLINDISCVKNDFLFILDDYHLIDSSEIHNAHCH